MNDFMKVLLVISVLIILYYIFTQDMIIKNEGMVDMSNCGRENINIDIENVNYGEDRQNQIKGKVLNDQIDDFNRTALENDQNKIQQKDDLK